MTQSYLFRGVAVALTSAGLLLPSVALGADAAPAARTQKQNEVIADVALGQGGVLRGQVVDAQNKPLAGEQVVLRATNGQSMSGKTNEQGQFAFSGLKGGTYLASTGSSSGVYRVWAADTAPPNAGAGVLLIPSSDTVRGQTIGGISRGTLAVLGITGGIVAAGVISQESSDDDDDPSS